MPEVSSLIAAPLWGYLHQHQVDVSGPQRQQQTRSARFGVSRLDWQSFAMLCQLAAAQDQRSGDLQDALTHALRGLPLGAPQLLLGWAVTPHQLYAQSIRWLLPTLIPAATITSRRLDDARIEVIAGLVEGADDCAPFFSLLGHLWGALPNLLQLPAALIDADVSARRGHYIITPPPALRLPRRLLSPRDGVTRAWAVAAGLHAQLGQARVERSALTNDKAQLEQRLAALELASRSALSDQLAADQAALASLEQDAAGREAALQAQLTRLEASLAALRTERDSFERLAAEARARLDETLRKGSADAQRALADAARWEQLVTLIVADAHAELRAPAELLEQLGRAAADSSADHAALGQRLQRLADALRSSMSHLLDLEQSYTGRLTLDPPQPLKPAQLIDALTSALAPDMEAGGNTLVVEATRGVQELTLDTPKLHKALLHLLRNADATARQSTIRLKLSRDRKPGTRFELRYQGAPLPLARWDQALARPDEPCSSGELPGAVRHTVARALIEALGGSLNVKNADDEQSLSFVLRDPNS